MIVTVIDTLTVRLIGDLTIVVRSGNQNNAQALVVNVNVRVLVQRDFVLNRTRKRAQVMLHA